MSFDFLRRIWAILSRRCIRSCANVVAGQSREIRRYGANAADQPPATIARQPARRAGVGLGATGLVSGQGPGSGGRIFLRCAGRTGIILPATSAACRRASRKSHRVASGEIGRAADAGRNRAHGWLQSVSLEPDIFDDNRHDHSAIHAPVAYGTRGELLKSGKFNVTEAALEVGYSSMSHFSQAFHETFGCCPGLYPLRTPVQKSKDEFS